MPSTAYLTAFFLFDIADAIDLAAVRRLVPAATSAPGAKPTPIPAGQIDSTNPPVTLEGDFLGSSDDDGWRVRYKAFDYGVLSIALTRALPDEWDALVAEGLRWCHDSSLPAAAEKRCRVLVERMRPVLSKLRSEFLFEDYLVFSVTHVAGADTSDAVLALRGSDIAQLLRGERETLSVQERDEVLRHRISYLSSDLVVASWNAAFVYDATAESQGILEIVEFANSQLLEFRYYDMLLDAELSQIYPQLQRPRWRHRWFGGRVSRATRQVHSLFIDVNELTDRTENALKIAGEVYTARLFTLIAARLGLDQWKGNVREKLKTLDDIYRFAVEQTAMARGELLEVMVVVILVIELVLFLLGIMT